MITEVNIERKKLNINDSDLEKQAKVLIAHLVTINGKRLDIITNILSYTFGKSLVSLYRQNGGDIVALRDYLEIFKSTMLDNYTDLEHIAKVTT